MLVLSRKESESICIGNGIEIRVASIRGGSVRLGIVAPPEVRVLRKEIIGRALTNRDEAGAAVYVKEEI